MIKKSYFIILLMSVIIISCTTGDPYAGISGSTGSSGTSTGGTSKNSSVGEVDGRFDATDQKIVAFIDQKVYEDAAQIKQVTVESLNKLLKEKNIRMTKREFLARTYQIIRDNNMNSFYLAAGRLLNQLK